MTPLKQRLSDRRTWRAATTLDHLAELTARWLEGRLATHPGTVGRDGPDEETWDLVPHLARLNRSRSGFLTSCSQPGARPWHFDGAKWHARAAVEGYVADRELHAHITTQARRAGLLVPPLRPYGTPVTLRDGEQFTAFGVDITRTERLFSWSAGRLLSRPAKQALAAAHPITIIEPAYGPSTRLWDFCDRTLTGEAR